VILAKKKATDSEELNFKLMGTKRVDDSSGNENLEKKMATFHSHSRVKKDKCNVGRGDLKTGFRRSHSHSGFHGWEKRKNLPNPKFIESHTMNGHLEGNSRNSKGLGK